MNFVDKVGSLRLAMAGKKKWEHQYEILNGILKRAKMPIVHLDFNSPEKVKALIRFIEIASESLNKFEQDFKLSYMSMEEAIEKEHINIHKLRKIK